MLLDVLREMKTKDLEFVSTVSTNDKFWLNVFNKSFIPIKFSSKLQNLIGDGNCYAKL